MSIFLVGYRGSGKTTVGLLLAGRLAKPFVDLDQQIVAMAEKSIKMIFAEDGEKYFRDLETQALLAAIQQPEQVIALGGGALIREENRAAIKAGGHQVVYLRCDASELVKRIAADPATAANRPNLTGLGGGLAEVQTLLAQREPIYRAVCHYEIDVTYLPATAVAEELMRHSHP